MNRNENHIDRRGFLKKAATTGLGAIYARGLQAQTDANQPPAEIPDKPDVPQVLKVRLGKTDIDIPILSFGTYQVDVNNQAVLRGTLKWGVDFWDTANNYLGGQSEVAIGKFLSKNPDVRKKLTIATKASGAKGPQEIESRLQTSLNQINIDRIDVYYGIHDLSDPARLTNELQKWAEDAKKRKLIRFFGFTTHSNMAECLLAASKLNWIDVIMMTCNFRVMQESKMQEAIEACHKSGIGLIAMKTQAHKVTTDEDKRLTDHFITKGFTEGQAKIKAVLQDKRITSACVGLQNIEYLNLGVAAALDKTKLTDADNQILAQYARETCSGYCAGCANICNSAIADISYTSDIMRYLMYYNHYGAQEEARALFSQIPANVRKILLSADYTTAEARCPQHIPIGELIAEAVSKLA